MGSLGINNAALWLFNLRLMEEHNEVNRLRIMVFWSFFHQNWRTQREWATNFLLHFQRTKYFCIRKIIKINVLAERKAT